MVLDCVLVLAPGLEDLLVEVLYSSDIKVQALNVLPIVYLDQEAIVVGRTEEAVVFISCAGKVSQALKRTLVSCNRSPFLPILVVDDELVESSVSHHLQQDQPTLPPENVLGVLVHSEVLGNLVEQCRNDTNVSHVPVGEDDLENLGGLVLLVLVGLPEGSQLHRY